jgi:thiol-disulfide isomerase/thioredoxin
LNDHYRCNGCGAARRYVNQYCPHCESTGPHDYVGDKSSRSNQPKRKVARKSAPSGSDTFEPAFHLEREEPHRKRQPSLKNEARGSSDDRDIHSVLFEKSPKFSISRNTWRNLAIGGFVLLLAVILVVNQDNIFSGTAKMVASIKALAASAPPHQPNPGADKAPPENSDKPAVVGSTPTTTPATTPASTPAGTPTTTPAVNPSSTSAAPNTPPADTTAPKLLGEPVKSVSDTTVNITWKTDEKSTSLVKYGPDTSYAFASSESAEKTIDHNVFIAGLSPAATYHFRIISTDAAGNTMPANDYTFTTDSSSGSGPYISGKAPNFMLQKLGAAANDTSQMLSLNQTRGKKVILNFWASWCGACKLELPHLQAIWDKYRSSNDVTVLTVVSSDSPKQEIKTYMDSNGFDFPVCFDVGDSSFNEYQLISIPKTFFLDKSGVIRRVQQGMFTSPSEIEFMLNSY